MDEVCSSPPLFLSITIQAKEEQQLMEFISLSTIIVHCLNNIWFCDEMGGKLRTNG